MGSVVMVPVSKGFDDSLHPLFTKVVGELVKMIPA